ncbi:unnamed protein product, partial [Musa banksii]
RTLRSHPKGVVNPSIEGPKTKALCTVSSSHEWERKRKSIQEMGKQSGNTRA